MRKLNYGSSNDNFQPNYQQNRPKEKYSHIDQRDDLESTHTLYPAVWYGRIGLVFGCAVKKTVHRVPTYEFYRRWYYQIWFYHVKSNFRGYVNFLVKVIYSYDTTRTLHQIRKFGLLDSI